MVDTVLSRSGRAACAWRPAGPAVFFCTNVYSFFTPRPIQCAFFSIRVWSAFTNLGQKRHSSPLEPGRLRLPCPGPVTQVPQRPGHHQLARTPPAVPRRQEHVCVMAPGLRFGMGSLG